MTVPNEVRRDTVAATGDSAVMVAGGGGGGGPGARGILTGRGAPGGGGGGGGAPILTGRTDGGGGGGPDTVVLRITCVVDVSQETVLALFTPTFSSNASGAATTCPTAPNPVPSSSSSSTAANIARAGLIYGRSLRFSAAGEILWRSFRRSLLLANALLCAEEGVLGVVVVVGV